MLVGYKYILNKNTHHIFFHNVCSLFERWSTFYTAPHSFETSGLWEENDVDKRRLKKQQVKKVNGFIGLFSFSHVKLHPTHLCCTWRKKPILRELEYVQLLLKCGTEQKRHSIYRLNEGDNLFQMSGGQQSRVHVLFCCWKMSRYSWGENSHKVNDQLSVIPPATAVNFALYSALSFVKAKKKKKAEVKWLANLRHYNSPFFLCYWSLKQGPTGADMQ